MTGEHNASLPRRSVASRGVNSSPRKQSAVLMSQRYAPVRFPSWLKPCGLA
jgi:hypothetical protein